MKKLLPRRILFLGLIIILFTIFARVKWNPFVEKTESSKKYVGFRMNGGRFGAQLFHLIAGYGIGRTLNRTHYLSLQGGPIAHVVKYLRQFKEVFPRLHETFVIAPYDANETRVEFSKGCCTFDNPLRGSGAECINLRSDKRSRMVVIQPDKPKSMMCEREPGKAVLEQLSDLVCA